MEDLLPFLPMSRREREMTRIAKRHRQTSSSDETNKRDYFRHNYYSVFRLFSSTGSILSLCGMGEVMYPTSTGRFLSVTPLRKTHATEPVGRPYLYSSTMFVICAGVASGVPVGDCAKCGKERDEPRERSGALREGESDARFISTSFTSSSVLCSDFGSSSRIDFIAPLTEPLTVFSAGGAAPVAVSTSGTAARGSSRPFTLLVGVITPLGAAGTGAFSTVCLVITRLKQPHWRHASVSLASSLMLSWMDRQRFSVAAAWSEDPSPFSSMRAVKVPSVNAKGYAS